jgi:hypothetical protein
MSVLGAMLEDERTKLCGPRYAHSATRFATMAGHATVSSRLGAGGFEFGDHGYEAARGPKSGSTRGSSSRTRVR